MNRRTLMLAAAGCLTLPVVAKAEGSIMVMNAMVRPPLVASIGVGSFYVMLMNHGSEADKLIGISTPAAQQVELHDTVEKDGFVSMSPLPSLDLPAGGMIELKTGGLHGMIMGIKGELKQGDTVPFTLKFEKAGEVSVTATVGSGTDQHNHSGGMEAPAPSN